MCNHVCIKPFDRMACPSCKLQTLLLCVFFFDCTLFNSNHLIEWQIRIVNCSPCSPCSFVCFFFDCTLFKPNLLMVGVLEGVVCVDESRYQMHAP
jgi:hypothetical protein